MSSSAGEISVPEPFLSRAVSLDRADRLAEHLDAFLPAEGVVAYLDGNSLGRPLRITAERMADFIAGAWGTSLIRGWDAGWMDLPILVGDRIAGGTLGAGPGQTVVGDSTTVQLYKLLRAAVAARPGRRAIIVDRHNFPTDRFVAEGVAAELGLELRWLEPDAGAGVTDALVQALLDEQVAVVMLSHVDFRSAYIADMATITASAHAAGALVLWDLCHSVGAVELELDRDGVDLAVGCTYKYLNGGPGAPAFVYVAAALQDQLRPPIQGWMGSADPFAMGPSFEPAAGIRRFIAGTPPIVGMLPLMDMQTLVSNVGMHAVRRKSLALTEFTIDYADGRLARYGVSMSSPREPERRGSHVLLEHPEFVHIVSRLWEQGVIPDFRLPQGLRIGLSPLSTGFVELARGLTAIEELLSTRLSRRPRS